MPIKICMCLFFLAIVSFGEQRARNLEQARQACWNLLGSGPTAFRLQDLSPPSSAHANEKLNSYFQSLGGSADGRSYMALYSFFAEIQPNLIIEDTELWPDLSKHVLSKPNSNRTIEKFVVVLGMLEYLETSLRRVSPEVSLTRLQEFEHHLVSLLKIKPQAAMPSTFRPAIKRMIALNRFKRLQWIATLLRTYKSFSPELFLKRQEQLAHLLTDPDKQIRATATAAFESISE